MKTVNLDAGSNKEGRMVQEAVRVEELDGDLLRLVSSPGLVDGLAARDLIRLCEEGGFSLVARGGNVAVRVFRLAGAPEMLPALEAEVLSAGGVVDGLAPKELVCTFPVGVGFDLMESIMARNEQRFPDCEWYYGNVYDPVTGKPLNWWNA